jgi:GT2 family glycosyltransferase
VLARCLRLAATQGRAPAEIIVIDASPGWRECRDEMFAMLRPIYRGRIEYEPARRASICTQRNQGAALATADVVVFLDDDSLMYPGCAEHMLAVYDADAGGEVAGVCAQLAHEPPDARGAGESAGADVNGPGAGVVPDDSRWKKALRRAMGADEYLPLYGARPVEPRVPPSCAGLHVTARAGQHGCRMSFRRGVVLETRFEEALARYAYLEDVDFCRRASKHGVYLIAFDARVCHLEHRGGRLRHFAAAATSAINPMVLHRLYSEDVRRSSRHFAWSLPRRAIFFLVKDLAKRRWSAPRARGILHAMRVRRSIMGARPEVLRRWYPLYQARLFAR